MARINIDDDVESRPEFRRLHKLLGYDDDKALGMLVRFWRLAQDYWGEHKLVPLEEIENWEFQPIIDSRWGMVKPEGVYAIGAEERFAWYRQKCDASKKGVEARQKKREEQATIDVDQPDVNRKLTADTVPVNPLVPVPVLAPVPAQKTKNKESIGETAVAIPPNRDLLKEIKSQVPDPEIGRFIGTYVKAFQVKYPPKGEGPPSRPDLRGKVQGQIKTYLKDVPIDRACDLIQAYCQMEDSWFKTKCHDFGTFLENQNKVSLALDRGEDPSLPQYDMSRFT